MERPQYSIQLEALAVYFLHSRPSVTWLNSRSSLVACDWVMSALSGNGGHRRKFGGMFMCGVYRPGNDCELVLTVKMETRHPVELFGNEFPSIYNYCWVMAAWSHKTEKRPLSGKFSKFCSDRIHRDTDRRVVFKFREFDRREIGKIVRCLPDKKISPGSPALATARIAPKIYRASPRECTQSAPDFVEIGSLSAELYRNAWTPSKRAVKCFQYSANLASSR